MPAGGARLAVPPLGCTKVDRKRWEQRRNRARKGARGASLGEAMGGQQAPAGGAAPSPPSPPALPGPPACVTSLASSALRPSRSRLVSVTTRQACPFLPWVRRRSSASTRCLPVMPDAPVTRATSGGAMLRFLVGSAEDGFSSLVSWGTGAACTARTGGFLPLRVTAPPLSQFGVIQHHPTWRCPRRGLRPPAQHACYAQVAGASDA